MLCFLLGNRLTPSAVDVADIMKTSAIVSWTAASSYIEHVVSVEGHCETVTRPGVHRCLITGKQLSISLGSKPVGVDCNRFQSSYSLYGGVICNLHPTTNPLLVSGLGTDTDIIFDSRGEFLGCARSRDLDPHFCPCWSLNPVPESLMAVNVTTRLLHTEQLQVYVKDVDVA